MWRSWCSRLRSRRTVANETPNRSAISSTLSEPDSPALQQLQDLLPTRAPRTSRRRATRSSSARSSAAGSGCSARWLIVFAHGAERYMRDVRTSTLDARFAHLTSCELVSAEMRMQASHRSPLDISDDWFNHIEQDHDRSRTHSDARPGPPSPPVSGTIKESNLEVTDDQHSGDEIGDRRPAPSGMSRATKVRWAVAVFCAVGLAINYIDRSAISVSLPFMTQDFHLTPTETGPDPQRLLLELRAHADPGGPADRPVR